MKALICILVSLMIVSAPAAAADRQLPGFDMAGTIDRLDFKAGEIVVGDMFYLLGPNLIIYDEKGRLGGRKLLREGVKVGISPAPASSASSPAQSIYAIRVLPKDYDLSEADD